MVQESDNFVGDSETCSIKLNKKGDYYARKGNKKYFSLSKRL